MSKIGIIGSGHVAQALAKGFLLTGNEVILSSRRPDIKKSNADTEILKQLDIVSFEEVLKYGDIIVVAVEGLAIEGIFESIDQMLVDDKIVIDITNPLIIVDKNIRFGRATGESNGMILQAMLPNAHVVKAFNTVNAHDMYLPKFENGIPSMMMCGNSEKAKEEVKDILRTFGWDDIIDIGGIEYSYETESYVSLWVAVAKHVDSFHLAMQFLRK